MTPIVTKNNNLLVPFAKIYPSYSVLYHKVDIKVKKSKEQEEQFEKIRTKKKFSGILSDVSQRKIRNIVNWLVLFSENQVIEIDNKKVLARLNFITLTLPTLQKETDLYYKNNLLNQFLTELRVKYPTFLYIWKAETQQNGNIHFHITTNLLIHYREIQNLWNRIINKIGHIDEYAQKMRAKYKNGFFYDLRQHEEYGINRDIQFLRYKKALSEGFRNPHTTEVKAVKNITNVAAYLSEYIAKNANDDRKRIKGRIYGCSKLLETIDININLTDYDFPFRNMRFVDKDRVQVFFAPITKILNTNIGAEVTELIIKHIKNNLNFNKLN